MRQVARSMSMRFRLLLGCRRRRQKGHRPCIGCIFRLSSKTDWPFADDAGWLQQVTEDIHDGSHSRLGRILSTSTYINRFPIA